VQVGIECTCGQPQERIQWGPTEIETPTRETDGPQYDRPAASSIIPPP
jgi:hypothetical protein